MRIALNIPLTLKEIAQAAGSPLLAASDATVSHVATNSKEVAAGDLFIALKGERTDGADFIPEAKARGGFILSERYTDTNISVSDTEEALLNIVRLYKSKLTSLKKTIAVTGSVGKTTTKNILREILASKYKVHATNKNFNNALGLFLTVITAPADTEILVLEMGMNHIGEIALLSQAATPDLAIITNIGNAHVGNLGSREMIAKAKLEVILGMRDKKLIVPYDEPLLNRNENFYTVSTKSDAADLFVRINGMDQFGSNLSVYSNGARLFDAHTAIPGEHIASALSFATLAAILSGVDIGSIKSSISALDPSTARARLIDVGGYKIYDDTYSSSPEAVIANFELLSLYCTLQRSCVLGDMLELGARTEELHRKIGEAVYKYGFRRLYALGVYSPFIARGAMEAGMPREHIFVNTDITAPEITAKEILENANREEIILVKASHALHAERIYEFLK